jgi:hypothetical protein
MASEGVLATLRAGWDPIRGVEAAKAVIGAAGFLLEQLSGRKP